MNPVHSGQKSPETLQVIDRVFRQVNREVWIVTAATDGERAGLTATWVSQASIDAESPLVLIGLAPNHYTAQLIQRSGYFGLHLLRSDQVEVAWNFARGSSRDRDKFLEAPARTNSQGIPLLLDCHGWLSCRVLQQQAVADRWYFWADVIEGDLLLDSNVPPDKVTEVLTDRAFFHALDDARRRELITRRDADIAIQRPWVHEWRQRVAPSPPSPPSP
jgi:flavin reductase (DIM6/NTAB) family NADH-FMN oxidoreductase RutF